LFDLWVCHARRFPALPSKSVCRTQSPEAINHNLAGV
jgi:hypothetical protein